MRQKQAQTLGNVDLVREFTYAFLTEPATKASSQKELVTLKEILRRMGTAMTVSDAASILDR